MHVFFSASLVSSPPSALTFVSCLQLMTYSPNAVWWAHGRLVALLLTLLFADLGWFYLCISVFSAEGRTQVFLLVYECFTLFVDCVSGLAKNSIHFVDLSRGGNWEYRGSYMFYTDVIASAIVLAATLGHYIVILFIHGISLNVVDVLIFVNMRIVFLNLKAKIAAYRNYRKLALDMDQRYPQVPANELQELNDSCAICREPMVSARRLPCAHIFHTACLRSWLEHNHTCPTCRHPLIDDPGQGRQARGAPGAPHGGDAAEPRRSIWSFNSNWMQWLPSLSVEVVRAGEVDPVLFAERNPAIAAQVAAVQGVFPDMPAGPIIRDLLTTGSAELTINNILEGRVTAPSVPAPPASPPAEPAPQAPDTPPPARRLGSESANSAPVAIPAASSPPSLRDSFGVSSDQRHLSLEQRKAQMLEFARRQFLEKQQRKAAAAVEAAAGVVSGPSQASSEEPDLLSSGLRRRAGHPEESSNSASFAAEPVPDSFPSRVEEPESQEDRRRKILEAAQRRLTGSQGQ